MPDQFDLEPPRVSLELVPPQTSVQSSQRSSTRPSAALPAFIHAAGDHGLIQEQLQAVLSLGDVAGQQEARLRRIGGRGSGATLLLRPGGIGSAARMPTIVRVVRGEDLHEEIARSELARELLGGQAPRLLDYAETAEGWAVLQLEMTGSIWCLPRFVDAVEVVASLADLVFMAVDRPEEGGLDRLELALQASNQIFRNTLAPCALRGAVLKEVDLGRSFSIRSLLEPGESAFYGLLADGEPPEVLELMVAEVSGSSSNAAGAGGLQQPLAYLQSFNEAMATTPQACQAKARIGRAHGSLCLDDAMVDADGRPWVASTGALRSDHAFADLGRWFGDGIFCVVPVAHDEDEEPLQELMLLLASAPLEDHLIASTRLPEEPEGISEAVSFKWRFARQCVSLFGEIATGEAPCAVMQSARLQMLWALLFVAVTVATCAQSKDDPRGGRLALFLALAVACRLSHQAGSGPKPAWLADRQRQWMHPGSTVSLGSQALSASSFGGANKSGRAENGVVLGRGASGSDDLAQQRAEAARRYVAAVGAREAWLWDPLAEERSDVLDEVVSLQAEGESKRRVLGILEVHQQLQTFQRLLIVGGPGSGKTLVTKQLVAYMAQDQLGRVEASSSSSSFASVGEKSLPTGRMPLRCSLIDLAPLVVECPEDALRNHIQRTLDVSSKRVLESERERGWLLILDGLDEVAIAKERILTWLEDIVLKETQHHVVLTTRPSALDNEARIKLRGCSFRVLTVEDLGEQQLRDLCARRAALKGSSRADVPRICEEILREERRPLARTPLLATLMVHHLRVEPPWMKPSDAAPASLVSRPALYEFAFRHLLARLLARIDERAAEDVFSTFDGPDEGLMELRRCDIGAAMTQLAYELQSTNRRNAEERDLEAVLGGSAAAAAALWHLCHRSGQGAGPGLLQPADQGIRFFHLSMQEYLSAVRTWDLLHEGRPLPCWIGDETNIYQDFAVNAGCFLCVVPGAPGGPSRPKAAEIVRRLLDGPGARGIGALLRNAARAGDVAAVRGLLGLTADTHRQALLRADNSAKETPLHLAAFFRREAAVRALLELADDRQSLLLAATRMGTTPLHYAIDNGHDAAVRTIVELAAEDRQRILLATNSAGETPLHYAALHGREAIVRSLLEFSPDRRTLLDAKISAGPFAGETPLKTAVGNGHEALRELLTADSW